MIDTDLNPNLLGQSPLVIIARSFGWNDIVGPKSLYKRLYIKFYI